jgi:hypothetical protein
VRRPDRRGSGGIKARAWYRTKWAIVGASILAVLVISTAAVTFVVSGASEQAGSSAPTPTHTEAIREWWSGAPITELQKSLDESQRALARSDGPTLEDACQQMHDIADVELQAHMATSDTELTSELRAATADAHAAAHMCLAAVAGTMNSYGGEFTANVDHAKKHLIAAQELVNEALIETP